MVSIQRGELEKEERRGSDFDGLEGRVGGEGGLNEIDQLK